MQPSQRKFGLKAFWVVTILFILGASYAYAGATSSTTSTALPEGVTFSGAYSADDVAYFQENLELLHKHLPSWWQYVLDARPFTIDIDSKTAKGSIMAVTKCCDTNGSSSVSFGYHLKDISVGSDTDSQSVEARRITFLGMLAHELTHVRDLRARRFTQKTDRKSCVTAELSGLSQQLQIKRDLATTQMATDPANTAIYTEWLAGQIRSENRDLHSRPFWDWYCTGFE